MPRCRGLGFFAFVLFTLWSAGCTATTATTSATATSTFPLTAAVPARTLPIPPPTSLALPTFPLHAGTVTASPRTSIVTPTVDPKQRLHALADWALGPSERQTSRVKAVYYDRYQPGDIVFEWWLYNYPSADAMKGNARVDACTILPIIAGGRFGDYTSAVLHGYLTPDQVLGHGQDGLLVVSLIYSRSTAQSIDFYGDPYGCGHSIYERADHSDIAPSFR